jgi:hypothetical protein
MTYRLGIDVGSTHTTWASVTGGADGAVDGGSIESALGIAADGQLVGGVAAAGASSVVRDFVARLGDSAPVMVGTTPYGAEALVAKLVGTVLDTARARHGGDPLAVVMVHDDGLDQYRTGLLAEAARLAGVTPAATVLVSRSEATTGGAAAAAGAAKAGWARVPDPIAPAAAGGIGALGVAGGAAAAATGVGAAALIADGGAATASAAAPAIAGPAGAPIAPAGPAGTPLTPAGPSGTPLQPAGPSGTPLQPAGPTGTPIQPAAGPGGTPLQPPATGPAGTPLQPPAAGPGGTPLPGATPPPTVPVTTGIGVPKPKMPKWVTIAVGGAAVVAIGVGIAIVASGDDSAPTLGGSEVTVGATDANGNTVTVPGDATDTTVGGGGAAEFDLTPILGTWMQPCEPYLAGDGASQGSMTVTSPGSNLLDVTIDGGTAKSVDCAGGFTSEITVTYHLAVTAAGTSAGVQAYVADQAGDPECTSIDQGACDMAMSGVTGSVPKAIGVDGSGQLVISMEPVSGGALPTTWEPMVAGSTRI